MTRRQCKSKHSLLAMVLLLPSLVAAQLVDLNQLPWTLDSETAVFDGKTATTIYTGLRFSQGNISIESDEGRASNGSENNRELNFSGNVVIVVNNGRIESDRADLQFVGSTLSKAIVTGSPASYELRRQSSDDITYAEAGRLVYDVQKGVIEFSDEATITESGNQISSNYLVYNIVERRINADSSGSADDRVRITYTPVNGGEEPSPAAEPDSDPEAESENP
jgi:lipopolysaccharide export system protein LptA